MARRARWLGGIGAFGLAMTLATSVLAQSSEPSSAIVSAEDSNELPSLGDSQAALAQVEASLSVSTDRANALKAEIAAMAGDRDKQNAALIAAGERVKLAETDVAKVEEKIGDLIVQELETRGRLDSADNSISTVLAALERITRNPPPALMINPSDALGSARGAMLITAILPQLRAKADQVVSDLTHLGEIKTQAQAEEAELKANFDILEEEQLRIATLIAARQQSQTKATTNLAAEEAAAADLAGRAASLKAQIEGLNKQAQAVATAADATAAANTGSAAPRLDSDTVRLALANTARTEPAVPFASARGFLAFPTGGVSVVNYGDGDGFGGISKGLSVVTRAAAPVLAPADGWVLYKGDYLNYGQIVILDTGQDYSVLLAGLASVSVQQGQFVQLGQQLGIMGSRTIGRTIATSAGASSPTLYIEMRKDNVPIDPTGWWAPTSNTTQSG